MNSRYFYNWCFFALFLTTACSDPNRKDFSTAKLGNTSLLHDLRISSIDLAPLDMPEAWNREALKKLGIRKIILYTKGGKNPEDTLRKLIFSYSKDHQLLTFTAFHLDEKPQLWTTGTIRLKNEAGSAHFSRYSGIAREQRLSFVQKKGKTLIIKYKNPFRTDTTFIYGNFRRPQAIIEKIGKRILTVNLFLPAGTSKKVIESTFKKLKIKEEDRVFAQCSVTFMNSDLPMETYLLDEHLSQISLLKSWKYETKRLITYTEWNGNTLVKTISLHYNGLLPGYFSIDDKPYYVEYQ